MKLSEFITALEAIKIQVECDPVVRMRLNGPVYSQGPDFHVAEPIYWDFDEDVILAVEE